MVYGQTDFKKETLVLHGITWEASDNIEYDTIDEFKTRDSTTPGYYIFQWKVNAYTLQEQYTCHVFDPTVIIPGGGLGFTSKFMTPVRKTSY